MPCPNELVRLLLHVKLTKTNSVFTENIRYLSFKYQIKPQIKTPSACTIYMSDNC